MDIFYCFFLYVIMVIHITSIYAINLLILCKDLLCTIFCFLKVIKRKENNFYIFP